MAQDEEQIRWAVTACKATPAALAQVPERLHPEICRRIEVERERSRQILREQEARIAAQLGPGEVSRGLYIDATS